jgi:hypothetical protein
MRCVVCTINKEIMNVSFLVELQNQGLWISQFMPQNRQLRFSDLGLKIITTVSCFGLQNQQGDGLLVVPQNQQEEVGIRHTLISSSLFHVESNRAMVF